MRIWRAHTEGVQGRSNVGFNRDECQKTFLIFVKSLFLEVKNALGFVGLGVLAWAQKGGYLPLPRILFWVTTGFIVLIAFFRTWKKERLEAERLRQLVLEEYRPVVEKVANGRHLVFRSLPEREAFYLQEIKGNFDSDLLKEAIRRWGLRLST